MNKELGANLSKQPKIKDRPEQIQGQTGFPKSFFSFGRKKNAKCVNIWWAHHLMKPQTLLCQRSLRVTGEIFPMMFSSKNWGYVSHNYHCWDARELIRNQTIPNTPANSTTAKSPLQTTARFCFYFSQYFIQLPASLSTLVLSQTILCRAYMLNNLSTDINPGFYSSIRSKPEQWRHRNADAVTTGMTHCIYLHLYLRFSLSVLQTFLSSAILQEDAPICKALSAKSFPSYSSQVLFILTTFY